MAYSGLNSLDTQLFSSYVDFARPPVFAGAELATLVDCEPSSNLQQACRTQHPMVALRCDHVDSSNSKLQTRLLTVKNGATTTEAVN